MSIFSHWKKLKKSTPEEANDFAELLEEEKVGHKDRFAMVLSAFLVIVLPCFLILVVISALALWLFGGFH